MQQSYHIFHIPHTCTSWRIKFFGSPGHYNYIYGGGRQSRFWPAFCKKLDPLGLPATGGPGGGWHTPCRGGHTRGGRDRGRAGTAAARAGGRGRGGRDGRHGRCKGIEESGAISPRSTQHQSKEQSHVGHHPDPRGRQGGVQEGAGRGPAVPGPGLGQQDGRHPGGRHLHRDGPGRGERAGQGAGGADLRHGRLHRAARPGNLGLAPGQGLPDPREVEGQADRGGEDRPRRGEARGDEGQGRPDPGGLTKVRGRRKPPPPFSGLESLEAGQRRRGVETTSAHKTLLEELRRILQSEDFSLMLSERLVAPQRLTGVQVEQDRIVLVLNDKETFEVRLSAV